MSEATMQCPKCPTKLDTHERHGVVIEECPGCRGVFLDRGELEQLIDAESRYLAELPDGENPDTTYQGRHRRGIMQQIFSR
ncbi:zf-TFIIB domain-containing protein [Actinomadura sp. WMMB 499]|uniref:TFIIB-type zinc ribbon-containing protein n=1 Tax=Actinomadura sp. WMMB 499 TaxID=1219491 RepID=UPI0012460562|nr:zf-TFIIB domain-containing protein [Actinomadura sp. WMMB 499]QFG23362.1 zf-TFIIB domain-containing protein [Actinomadura sp. WMMB 499]